MTARKCSSWVTKRSKEDSQWYAFNGASFVCHLPSLFCCISHGVLIEVVVDWMPQVATEVTIKERNIFKNFLLLKKLIEHFSTQRLLKAIDKFRGWRVRNVFASIIKPSSFMGYWKIYFDVYFYDLQWLIISNLLIVFFLLSYCTTFSPARFQAKIKLSSEKYCFVWFNLWSSSRSRS